MGSYQECENEFILGADEIIVDRVAQCLHRGALRALAEKEAPAEDKILAATGEIAAGKKPAQIAKNEGDLYIPIGSGAIDVAVATAVLERPSIKI